MSWVCPYQLNDECTRLRKKCQPLQRGCVMEGEVTCIEYQENNENKEVLRKRRTNKRTR